MCVCVCVCARALACACVCGVWCVVCGVWRVACGCVVCGVWCVVVWLCGCVCVVLPFTLGLLAPVPARMRVRALLPRSAVFEGAFCACVHPPVRGCRGYFLPLLSPGVLAWLGAVAVVRSRTLDGAAIGYVRFRAFALMPRVCLCVCTCVRARTSVA